MSSISTTPSSSEGQYECYSNSSYSDGSEPSWQPVFGAPATWPIRKLTTNIIDTYKGINEVYSRKKREEELALSHAQRCIGTGDFFKNGGDFVLGERLGGGVYGQVFELKELRQPERALAVKVSRKTAIHGDEERFYEASRFSLRREFEILKRLHREEGEGRRHIIEAHDYVVFPTKQEGITMDRMACSLLYAIESTHEGFSIGLTMRVAHQLFLALGHLKKCGIVHRDIKPDNIALPSRRRCQVKLIDFGRAKEPSDTGSGRASLWYQAPECERYEMKEAADLWSVVTVITELLSKKALFGHFDDVRSTTSYHQLRLGGLVGFHFVDSDKDNKMMQRVFSFDEEGGRIRPGEAESYYNQVKRGWEEVFTPQLKEAKFRQVQSPAYGARAGNEEDWERLQELVRRGLDPNPATRITCEEALQMLFNSSLAGPAVAPKEASET